MQPATTVPRTQTAHEESLASSHWDLRRKIALENLRNTSAAYLSAGAPKRLHLPSRNTATSPASRAAEVASVKLGKPIGVAEPQRRLLPTMMTPPIFRRRSYAAQGAAAAQVFELPLSGLMQGAARLSEAAKPKEHSAVSIKRVLAFSTFVVVVFTFLYWLSNGIASSVPNEVVQLKEHFFFSLRSFLTASSFDLAPINTLGRLLYSIEGVIGMMTMIVVSIVVSEKVAKV
ncbi:MAG: hypothetical protein Q7T04_05130 [Dehalococcoidia bacterium]|nr:hypothetical protein [Dehalococcoidia bacterium]